MADFQEILYSFSVEQAEETYRNAQLSEISFYIGRAISLITGVPEIGDAFLGEMLRQEGITQTTSLKFLVASSKTLFCQG
jgi:hypothetical protein